MCSTTPKSSKVCGIRNRVILADIKNVSICQITDKTISLRKRAADVFLQSRFLKINNKNDEVLARSDNVPCKRRRNALRFEHENDKDIPASVRSLHRVQSLSVLETSRTINLISPDYIEHYSLRTVEKPQSTSHCAFRCISGETLSQLLISLTQEQFCSKFFLVDCRYPFEYLGGHIKNAVNVYDINQVQSIFYPKNIEKFCEINSKIPIFYCEFSQKRGPSMALELRRQDRTHNEQNYPKVDYKEIYVLDQGYQKFFGIKRFLEFCEPEGYVPMLHSSYVEDLKRYRFHLHNHTQAKMQRRHAFFHCKSFGNTMPTVTEGLESTTRQFEGRSRLRLSVSSSCSGTRDSFLNTFDLDTSSIIRAEDCERMSLGTNSNSNLSDDGSFFGYTYNTSSDQNDEINAALAARRISGAVALSGNGSNNTSSVVSFDTTTPTIWE